MRDYFCGWYFKCQSDKHTLAVIPAFHRSNSKKSCSIQLITDTGAWNIDFPYERFNKQKGIFEIFIGNNYFSSKGINLCINMPSIHAVGSLSFGTLSPIQYDIMGPFRYVPFMECRHSVYSMTHTVNGNLSINGINYNFNNSLGYIEGDRGYSFPKEYIWTQCIFKGGSLMLSVADIPFGLFHFTGIIGVIHLDGKEYRLATYLGAKPVKIENGEIIIRQNDAVLSVKLIEKHTHPLLAPISGAMKRTIHESASCRAAYSFHQKSHTILEFETSNASFEYEYQH